MKLLCLIFGHDWERSDESFTDDKDPMFTSSCKICKRCGKEDLVWPGALMHAMAFGIPKPVEEKQESEEVAS